MWTQGDKVNFHFLDWLIHGFLVDQECDTSTVFRKRGHSS